MWAAALAALVLGCSDADAPELPCAERPVAADAVACAEAAFWSAFHTPDAPAREAAHATLTEVIDRHPDAPAIARAYFLRGCLGVALSIENQLGSAYIEGIVPDFERTILLEPDNVKAFSWLDSMELVLAYLGGDAAALERHGRDSVANAALHSGNVLTISGTMSGLPVDTGFPARAVELLEAWTCEYDWCRRNSVKVPFVMPGLQVHFADAYARVGDRERAEQYLLAALAAADADAWPYRDRAETMLAELDRIVDDFVALGDSDPAINLVYANSDIGCLICHGNR